MLILSLVLPLVVIPFLAIKGHGYRGAYLGVALFAIVMGIVCLALPGSLGPTATEAERVGTELINAYAPNVGGWLLTTGFACIIGATMFRARVH